MASITCTRSDIFPNTTAVKAYPRTGAHMGQTGPPAGISAGEGTMTSGTFTIEGLTAGAEYTLYAEVGGKDAYLAVQAPASTALTVATGQPGPSLQGLLAQSFDPATTAVGNKFKLTTAGTLYKARIPVKEEITVSNVLLYVVKEGATLTALENFLGLFAEGTRKLIANATAAETIAAFEHAPGIVTVPLVAPAVIGPGYVDFGAYHKGTTAPELLTAAAATAGILSSGQTNAKLRASSADTGLTTALPATMNATQTALAALLWVGLS
jgi:hypothetical protein